MNNDVSYFQGKAYENMDDASEFGLPQNYTDPNEYKGTSPECEQVIGVARLY